MESKQRRLETDTSVTQEQRKENRFEIVVLEERIAPSSLIGPANVHIGPVQVHHLL